MYVWRATYQHKGKIFVAYGLFKYATEDDASWEYELLADLKLYKFAHGVPMSAVIVKAEVVTWVH